MARSSDPDSAGSQFFTGLDKPPRLDGSYTAFGRTADDASLEVVRTIGSVATGAQDRLIDQVRINKVMVHQNCAARPAVPGFPGTPPEARRGRPSTVKMQAAAQRRSPAEVN